MIEKGSELMEISSQEKFLKNYKAVYNAMTAKPDCRSKAYPKNVIVSIDDIIELNDKIFEKFKTQYETIGFSSSILVSFKGRDKLEFPNWISFSEHNWTESSTITNMILVREFNIKLPKYNVPQRHTLTVKLSNGIRPEEMFALMLSGKLEEVDEIDQNLCPIVAKMDFIDMVIGNEVLGIVSEWVKSLKSSNLDKNKFIQCLQKNKRKLAYFINYFTLFFAIICSTINLNYIINSFNVNSIGELSPLQTNTVINITIFCVILCMIIYKLTEICAQFIFNILSNYGDEHIFNITKGDKNQQDAYRKKEQNDRKKIVWNLIITILINIACGITTYFITKGK